MLRLTYPGLLTVTQTTCMEGAVSEPGAPCSGLRPLLLRPFQLQAVLDRHLPHSHGGTPKTQLLIHTQLTLTLGPVILGSPYSTSGPPLCLTSPTLSQSTPTSSFAVQVLTEYEALSVYSRLGPLFWKLLVCASESPLSFTPFHIPLEWTQHL